MSLVELFAKCFCQGHTSAFHKIMTLFFVSMAEIYCHLKYTHPENLENAQVSYCVHCNCKIELQIFEQHYGAYAQSDQDFASGLNTL